MITGSFGKDGWINYTFNRSYDNPYPSSDFDIRLNPTQKSKILSFNEAANNVAIDLSNNYSNLYLAMSGGTDSEYIAETFKRLDINFTPIIFELDELNYLDVWHAHRWCKINNYKPVVIKYDLASYTEVVLTQLKEFYTRTAGGTAVLRIIRDYVRKHNGSLVTGGGDLEYFPDPTFFHPSPIAVGYDKKIENSLREPIIEGFVMNEPDLIRDIMMHEMPFNFYSWTPEIVLSYVAARDLSKNNEENKEMLTRCYPRPKNMGIPAFVFSSDYELSNIIGLKDYLGSSECDFLGSKDDLIKLLS
jgi:hypothetical protein